MLSEALITILEVIGLVGERILFPMNGCRIYVDIMTGEKLSSIQVTNMDIIYYSVLSSSRKRRVCGKYGQCGYLYYSQLQVLLYLDT